jgi:predicted enzyme related to lactoylglutathione lyase
MVTRDTPWPAGTPAWADVTVDDVPTAIAFYRALFGWDIEPAAEQPAATRSAARTARSWRV